MPVEDPAMAGAPVEEAPAEGQDPMQMLVEGAMEAVQTNNAELALQVCGGLVELVQQSMGGAGEAEPAGEPVFRKGGVLAYRKGGCAKKAKKCQGGAKMGQQNNGPKSLPNKGNVKQLGK